MSGVPRPPPSAEQVDALAKRERVPARIAKGELEGKMKCRIWRKLHADEAKRFDQVYEMMGKHPGLSLPDAFGVLQSGCTVDEFLARKSRQQKKAEVKQARKTLPNDEIEALFGRLIESEEELTLVLSERTLMDVLEKVEPIAFELRNHGRQEKLQVVLVARRAQWESLSASLPREPKLSQKPVPVARQPDKRPFSDPRPFVALEGARVQLLLRNGIQLVLPLIKVGPFDLLLGSAGEELVVPLHALLRWAPEGQPLG